MSSLGGSSIQRPLAVRRAWARMARITQSPETGRVDGVLDQVFEGVAHVVAAQVEEARGVGVTVEGCHRAQVVVLDDAVGMDPVDELLLDGFAFWVFADHAFACVTCSKCGLCCSAGARAI